jgi:hypothetical protein
MKREPVKSSSIKSVGYEDHSKILKIEFCRGRVYQYFGVPRRVYFELMTSESKGTFVNKIIKSFPYEEVVTEGSRSKRNSLKSNRFCKRMRHLDQEEIKNLYR